VFCCTELKLAAAITDTLSTPMVQPGLGVPAFAVVLIPRSKLRKTGVSTPPPSIVDAESRRHLNRNRSVANKEKGPKNKPEELIVYS
jgi:hypothetical protein